MASPPRVRALLFCDAVVRDPITGKSTLVGVFGQLGATEFPAVQEPFEAFVLLTGLNGRYRFHLEILSEDLATVIERIDLSEPIDFDTPLAEFAASVALDSVVWPSPGRYTVRLVYNGRIADETALTVGEVE